MPRRKAKKSLLKRKIRFMLRFKKEELSQFQSEANKVGLSKAEFARRRILGVPVVDAEPAEETGATA